MPEDLSPATVLRRLERGQSVIIPSSTRHIVLTLILALVIGVGLLIAFVWIVAATISEGRSWWLVIANLRMWVFVVGIIGCLVVAPIGVVLRLRRREALVVSPAGVALARRGRVVPGTLLPWHDMKAIVYERAASRGPKVLGLHPHRGGDPAAARARPQSALDGPHRFRAQPPPSPSDSGGCPCALLSSSLWTLVGPHTAVLYR
ncbi:hypothetical protein [Brevibacterium oceani]|uniref:hypothetical protein n=1 Tax=Brevibacterium oceani TaxID=358099 RepID=UPI001B318D38|nr:hypothetical protein [Brevibacterium oceani]